MAHGSPAEPRDPEHLPVDRDHVGRFSNELECRRAVQSGNHAPELTMAIGEHEIAGIRLGRGTLRAPVRPVTLRKPVQPVPRADLHVDEQRGTRGEGHNPTARAPQSDRLACFRRVRQRAGLADEDGGPDPLEPCRDDVALKSVETLMSPFCRTRSTRL